MKSIFKFVNGRTDKYTVLHTTHAWHAIQGCPATSFHPEKYEPHLVLGILLLISS